MTLRARLGRRADPPQEYVIIVGGPSNPYNGYYYESGALPGTTDLTPSPPPVDSTAKAVMAYTRGTLSGVVPHMHDRYWANFIYSAVKLVETGQIRPRAGDILTLMVYLPGYWLRDRKDWRASPYNPKHQHSAWVQGHYPFDPHAAPPDPTPSIRRKPDVATRADVLPPRSLAPYPRDWAAVDLAIFMLEINDMKTGPGVPQPFHPEMPDGGFPRLIQYPGEHMNLVLNVPARLALGSRYFGGVLPDGVRDNIPPTLRDVEIKMLFLDDDLTKLYQYLTTGTWVGPRWLNFLIEPGTEISGTPQPLFFPTYGPAPSVNTGQFSRRLISISMTEDPQSPGTVRLGATWTAYIPPIFTEKNAVTNASVDRTRVKIKRFDYFGHSGGRRALEDAFYLRWGWANAKGEVPWAEVYVPLTDLKEQLSQAATPIFSDDSFVKLWGCKLANQLLEDSMAHMLSGFASKTMGADDLVDYSSVINPQEPDAMPGPTQGPSRWLSFERP